MNLGKNVSKIFRVVSKHIPGTVIDCTWPRATKAEYDPSLGETVQTVVEKTFRAMRSTYNAHQVRDGGIQAGDVPIFIDANTVSAAPEIGDEISWDDKAWEVIHVKDTAGLLYELQMREKG